VAKSRMKKLDRKLLRTKNAEAISALDAILFWLERSRGAELLTSDGEQLEYLLTEARRQLGTAKVMYLESDVALGWTREK
jgi:hypothetical protein